MDKELWNDLYNSVFRMFLPPETYIKKIIINHNNKKIEFKSSNELFAYMSINLIDDLDDEDIMFYLKDNSLKKEVENDVNKILTLLKKGK